MKSKKILLVVMLVGFVALMGGVSVLYEKLAAEETTPTATPVPQEETQNAPTPTATPQGVEAPNFTMLDGDGNEVKLSSFEGKPVVLNFWASWCGPCRSEMASFQKAYEEYGDKVHFIMLNQTDGMRETMESAKAFIEEQGYTFPVYYDTMFQGAMAYGVTALPTSYFIDAEGVARLGMIKSLSHDELQRGIDTVYTPEG